VKRGKITKSSNLCSANDRDDQIDPFVNLLLDGVGIPRLAQLPIPDDPVEKRVDDLVGRYLQLVHPRYLFLVASESRWLMSDVWFCQCDFAVSRL
jgi:hypothetical protein